MLVQQWKNEERRNKYRREKVNVSKYRWSQKPKLKDAITMHAKGTDMLSSTVIVVGRDSITVATKEINATFSVVWVQSNCKYPRAEK